MKLFVFLFVLVYLNLNLVHCQEKETEPCGSVSRSSFEEKETDPESVPVSVQPQSQPQPQQSHLPGSEGDSSEVGGEGGVEKEKGTGNYFEKVVVCLVLVLFLVLFLLVSWMKVQADSEAQRPGAERRSVCALLDAAIPTGSVQSRPGICHWAGQCARKRGARMFRSDGRFSRSEPAALHIYAGRPAGDPDKPSEKKDPDGSAAGIPAGCCRPSGP